jgi:ribosomal protein S18 acetylase RimI-like enzyme
VEALARFLEENNVPAVVRTFSPFPMTAETAREIVAPERRDHFYGAFLNDERIVGLSMLRGWDQGYTVPSFGIIVDHRFHGIGIGTRMLDYTIHQAIQLGSRRIRLSVFASNQVALRLYLSRGFFEDSRQSTLLLGEPDESIVMFKELDSPYL